MLPPIPSGAPTVCSIQVSRGGVPKLPVPRARVTVGGVGDDDQADKVHHGGPDRAVCLYSAELIEALAAEGHPITPGSVGENLTIRGLDWPSLGPGARLRVGNECVLEITLHAPPCKTIAGSFAGGAFSRILETKHPGWSRLCARVLAEGEVKPGDRVEVVRDPD